MAVAFLKTPVGTAMIEGDINGLSRISIIEDEKISDGCAEEFQPAISQLNRYFAGNLTEFDLKLNPKGTPFQRKVWEETRKIPSGKTFSYLDLAKRLGDPKAIRAVAAANAKNPLWIVIPCHRVIGTDGSLIGYAGGLWRKKWLLDHENPVKQQSLF